MAEKNQAMECIKQRMVVFFLQKRLVLRLVSLFEALKSDHYTLSSALRGNKIARMLPSGVQSVKEGDRSNCILQGV